MMKEMVEFGLTVIKGGCYGDSKEYRLESTREQGWDLFDGFLSDYEKDVADFFGIEYKEDDILICGLADELYGDDL